MSHGRHAAGIGRLQLIDEAHDAPQLLDHAIDLIGANLEAGQMGNLLHILTSQFHGNRTIDNARREATAQKRIIHRSC
jgi:hypothetical protein